jgi:hypothetical protein
MNISSLSSAQHSFHSASIQRQSQPTITTVTGASGYGTANMMNNVDSTSEDNTQLANVNASQSNQNYTFNQLA